MAKKPTRKPVYRRNLDDAPRPVAAMAGTWPNGSRIPYHMHRRGQLLYAVSGIMRVETDDAAWIVAPTRALWLPPQMPHSVTMRSHLEMRTLYIDPSACSALPPVATFVEVGGLLRALIIAALEEPPDHDEAGRGGLIARLILIELAGMRERPMAVPIPQGRACRPHRPGLGAAARHRPRSRPLGRTGGRQPAHVRRATALARRARLSYILAHRRRLLASGSCKGIQFFASVVA